MNISSQCMYILENCHRLLNGFRFLGLEHTCVAHHASEDMFTWSLVFPLQIKLEENCHFLCSPTLLLSKCWHCIFLHVLKFPIFLFFVESFLPLSSYKLAWSG